MTSRPAGETTAAAQAYLMPSAASKIVSKCGPNWRVAEPMNGRAGVGRRAEISPFISYPSHSPEAFDALGCSRWIRRESTRTNYYFRLCTAMQSRFGGRPPVEGGDASSLFCSLSRLLCKAHITGLIMIMRGTREAAQMRNCPTVARIRLQPSCGFGFPSFE